jgi:hypothetical protein
LDPDPHTHPHESDKLDPDPHQFEDDKAKYMEYEPILALCQGFDPYFEARIRIRIKVKGGMLIRINVTSWIRIQSQIRIRIKVTSRIRIRFKVFQIRNTAMYVGNLTRCFRQ